MNGTNPLPPPPGGDPEPNDDHPEWHTFEPAAHRFPWRGLAWFVVITTVLILSMAQCLSDSTVPRTAAAPTPSVQVVEVPGPPVIHVREDTIAEAIVAAAPCVVLPQFYRQGDDTRELFRRYLVGEVRKIPGDARVTTAERVIDGELYAVIVVQVCP